MRTRDFTPRHGPHASAPNPQDATKLAELRHNDTARKREYRRKAKAKAAAAKKENEVDRFCKLFRNTCAAWHRIARPVKLFEGSSTCSTNAPLPRVCDGPCIRMLLTGARLRRRRPRGGWYLRGAKHGTLHMPGPRGRWKGVHR